MAIKLISGENQRKANGTCVHSLVNFNVDDKSTNMPLAVSSVLVEAGSESVIESHESVEMWVVIRGQGVVYSDGVDYDAKAGDVFYFDALVEHKVKNMSNKSMLITSVWCKGDKLDDG